jgi:N-acetyl sugar amidotransferase
MRYCKKCVMPDTRPGLIFDEEGVCLACRNYERRSTVDWKARRAELHKLCNKYRREDGYYNCIIPVSGGKDSHYLTYMMKEQEGMNPLLITVGDPFTKTQAGVNNLQNLGEAFRCDHITFNLSADLFRRVTKIGFEDLGEPLRFIEAGIYTVPIKLAMAMGIPLVVYGENAHYEFGTAREDTNNAMRYISEVFKKIDFEFWLAKGISKKELNAIVQPLQGDLERVHPDPIFMSFYTPWDGDVSYQIAKRYGFTDLAHEWKREGNIEDFDQIDSIAYIVHLWLKYPKFGFARTTDIASRWIRKGKITRDKAKELLMRHDHKLDQRAMEDFISFLGYTRRQFWDIVEQFWNPELFENVGGIWQLKNPVYSDLMEGY